MQKLISLYEEHEPVIQNFLELNLARIDINGVCPKMASKIFDELSYLELLYTTNESFLQDSPNYYKRKTDSNEKNKQRDYLIDALAGTKENLFFSKPYISTATNKLCITMVTRLDTQYVFFDFNLERLLERLNFLEESSNIKYASKRLYLFATLSILVAASALEFICLYTFFQRLFDPLTSFSSLTTPATLMFLGFILFLFAKGILQEELYFNGSPFKKFSKTKKVSGYFAAMLLFLSLESLTRFF